MRHIYLNILFLIVLVVLNTTNVLAQQDIMTSSKMENLSLLNPAYKSATDRATFIFQHRSQWVGFDGAPTTDIVNYNSKTLFKSINYGLSLINDKIGPSNNLKIHANLAYVLKIRSKQGIQRKITKIIIGVKPGINIYSSNFSEIKLSNQNDVAYATDKTKGLSPNFGVGIFYYKLQYYFGFSSPNIISRKGGFNQNQNHYYLIGGGSFRVNRNERIMFEPEVVIKITKGAPIQADLNLNYKLQYKYIIGLLARSGGAVGINLGVEALNNFYIIYSFGYSYSNTTFTNNSGTHDIMLRYQVPGFSINKTKRRHRIGKGNRW